LSPAATLQPGGPFPVTKQKKKESYRLEMPGPTRRQEVVDYADDNTFDCVGCRESTSLIGSVECLVPTGRMDGRTIDHRLYHHSAIDHQPTVAHLLPISSLLAPDDQGKAS
jgi:hypothetical protein